MEHYLLQSKADSPPGFSGCARRWPGHLSPSPCPVHILLWLPCLLGQQVSEKQEKLVTTVKRKTCTRQRAPWLPEGLVTEQVLHMACFTCHQFLLSLSTCQGESPMGQIQPSACRGQSANYPLLSNFSLQCQETLVLTLLLHAQGSA